MMMMKVVECLANEQDDCDDRQGQTLKGDPPSTIGWTPHQDQSASSASYATQLLDVCSVVGVHTVYKVLSLVCNACGQGHGQKRVYPTEPNLWHVISNPASHVADGIKDGKIMVKAKAK